jgi:hypothetical protein
MMAAKQRFRLAQSAQYVRSRLSRSRVVANRSAKPLPLFKLITGALDRNERDGAWKEHEQTGCRADHRCCNGGISLS